MKEAISSQNFRSFVENVRAIDLGFSGSRFTWSNKRCGVANIRERLDRGLCNIEWQSLFPYAMVRHLTAPNSDHNLILLDTHVEVEKGSKPFLFEAIWVKDESSSKVVEKAWSINVEGSQNFILGKKFQTVRRDFIYWNKMVFGNAKVQIKAIEDQIKAIQDLDPSRENLDMEVALNVKLNEWLEREEAKWLQKSRELWLREGDQNTKFFHSATMVHRRCNLISEIKTNDGQWIHSRQEIEAYFSTRFHQVFQSSHPQVPSHLEGLVSPCISEAENNKISKIPNAAEIREVVWSMHPLKALGPNGLPSLFFKKYWPIVGDQMVVAIQSFFRDGCLVKNSNHT